MDFGINFSGLISVFFTMTAPVIFTLWPLMILAAFVNTSKRFALGNVIALWILLLIFRVGMYVHNVQPMNLFFIQEPLSTILFFTVGLVMIGFEKIRSHRKVQRISSARSVDKLLELTPMEFERAIGEMYKSRGYKVIYRGKQGDHGIDLIVRNNNGEKWVVQCKQWKDQVGEPVIRDIFGAMHHEDAQGAVVVTTGSFSYQAIEWAKGKPIHLYNGEKLAEILSKRE
jgi:HJR/Mrr/RecB family endonuclease